MVGCCGAPENKLTIRYGLSWSQMARLGMVCDGMSMDFSTGFYFFSHERTMRGPHGSPVSNNLLLVSTGSGTTAVEVPLSPAQCRLVRLARPVWIHAGRGGETQLGMLGLGCTTNCGGNYGIS